MKANVGGVDKIVRIIAGIALIALAALNVEPIGAWGYIGVVPLLTGIFNFCPLYTVLGFSTCPVKKGA